MIAKLNGLLDEVCGDFGLVRVSKGICYAVFLPPSLLDKVGEVISLYTYLHVREDELTLYGFESRKEQTLFNYLLSVDGVGPKLAYKIICFGGENQIISAVNENNVQYFQSISGVGKKTAHKILLELSGRLGEEFEFSLITKTEDDILIIEALKSLGFSQNDIHKSMSTLDRNAGVEERIKIAIQRMTTEKK